MSVAAGEPIGMALRPRGGGRTAEPAASLRNFGRRRRRVITISGSLVTAAILAFVLAGRRDEFAAALSGAAAWVLAVTVLSRSSGSLAKNRAGLLAPPNLPVLILVGGFATRTRHVPELS